VAGPSRPAIARAPVCRTGAFGLVVGISPNVRPRRSNGRSWVLQVRRRDSESSVDDLGTWRGVVLGRAVTTLRSVETQPYAWGFVLSVRRGPTTHATRNRFRSLRAMQQPRTAVDAHDGRTRRDVAACMSVDAHDGRARGTAWYVRGRKKFFATYGYRRLAPMVVRSDFFFL
jgi:hypothetical protein